MTSAVRPRGREREAGPKEKRGRKKEKKKKRQKERKKKKKEKPMDLTRVGSTVGREISIEILMRSLRAFAHFTFAIHYSGLE
jgi:hypothetical protein